MRLHVGWHILKGHLRPSTDLCGFCGKNGCQVALQKGSKGSKRNKILKVWSDCEYYHIFNFKSDYEKVVPSNPCTNRPVICEICQGTYWTYNMKIHYEQSHNHITVPKYVSDQERVAVLKMF